MFLKNNYDIYNDGDILHMLEVKQPSYFANCQKSVDTYLKEEAFDKAHNYGQLLDWIKGMNSQKMGQDFHIQTSDDLTEEQKIQLINKILADV